MKQPSSRRRPLAALVTPLVVGLAAALGFRVPLSRVVGVIESAPDDWRTATVAAVLGIGAACFGLAPALGRKWRERAGPRKSAFLASLAALGGYLLAGLGVFLHEIELVSLGYGALGAGLGIVLSTSLEVLRRKFSRRRGLGLALPALVVGAVLGAPLAEASLAAFASLASAGVWETLLGLGSVYAVGLLVGALFL